jgi:hypothetical protein
MPALDSKGLEKARGFSLRDDPELLGPVDPNLHAQALFVFKQVELVYIQRRAVHVQLEAGDLDQHQEGADKPVAGGLGIEPGWHVQDQMPPVRDLG